MNPPTMSNSASNPSSSSNTKQLFATHSLADLANIAGKLRADVAKRDAQLATALADEYPHLLSACNTILSVKQATLNLCDATVALNTKDQGQWHGTSSVPSAGVVLKLPPAVPHSRHVAVDWQKEEPFIQVLDDAWSSMCTGDFASAITHLSSAATSVPLAMCQTTLTLARPLVAADFVRHTASSTLASSSTPTNNKLQSEYALVQGYAHLPDLAPTFLTHHHETIVASLVAGDTRSVDRAIRAAIHVHMQCLAQLNMPAEHAGEWATGLQSALANWIQAYRTSPPASAVDHAQAAHAYPEVAATWSKWLADVQFTLQQDAVQAMLAEVRAAITHHVTSTLSAGQEDVGSMHWVSVGHEEQGGGTPLDLRPLHAKVEALVGEMHVSPGAGEFFNGQVDKVLRELAPEDAAIDVTVRSLVAAGHILGSWHKIHASLTPHLDRWTRAWCESHVHVLDQPCAVGDLPTPGLVEVMFELLSDMQAMGMLQYSFVTKHILRTTAAWLATHYAARPLTHTPADVVFADMALIDRVCGTSERDQVATALGINGPDHDTTRASASALATAAMQSWGILLQSVGVDPPVSSVAASAPQVELPPGFTLDPVDRMGPLLPPVPVGPQMGLSIVTGSAANTSSGGGGGGGLGSARTSTSRHGSNSLLPIADPGASAIQSPLKHSPLPNGGHLLFGARAAQFWTHTRSLFAGAHAGEADGGGGGVKGAETS